MNGRIPRFMLLVVLLVSMLGIAGYGGTLSGNRMAVAQGSCGVTTFPSDATPIPPNLSIPQPGEDFDIQYSAITSPATNQPTIAPKSLTQLIVHYGQDFYVFSEEETIIHVDEGGFLLNVCGDPQNSQVVVVHQNGEPETITAASAPDFKVVPGDTIFVDKQDEYVLQAVESSGSIAQPLDFELSTDALPTALAEGTQVTVASGGKVMFCSRIRCVTP